MIKRFLYVILFFIGACSIDNEVTTSTIVRTSCNIDSAYINQKNDISQHIKKLIDGVYSGYGSLTGLHIDKDVEKLYQQNGYQPLWYDLELRQDGVQLLKTSTDHGLLLNDYGVNIIDSVINSSASFSAKADADLDIAITNSVILYGKHLQYGKVNPMLLSSEWNYERIEDSVLYLLVLRLIKDDSVAIIERVFEQKSKLYQNLKIELNKYRDINISNPNIELPKYNGVAPRMGDNNMLVLKTKRYLVAMGYLSDSTINSTFDNNLYQSIKAFQKIHGLAADGIPGKMTYDFMLWMPRKYIDVIRVNMERCRWMTNAYNDTCITVNVPEYKVRLYKNGGIVFESNVIVGKLKNKTPVFQSKIDYLVFNPCWTVPNSIASKKMLPRIKRDSTYLQKRNMFVGRGGVEVDSKEIDFSNYSESNFPFKIYQRSCSTNALGRVKFMFSNKYQVFLHDTPNKTLFKKDVRAFSSGCIRMESPLQLAEIILRDIDDNSTSVSRYLSKNYPLKVYLKTPVDFNIVYFTCWYNNKQMHYFNDIYSRDYKVLKELGLE